MFDVNLCVCIGIHDVLFLLYLPIYCLYSAVNPETTSSGSVLQRHLVVELRKTSLYVLMIHFYQTVTQGQCRQSNKLESISLTLTIPIDLFV